MKIQGPTNKLIGDLQVMGDKSISHRAIIHASLSSQESLLKNVLRAGVTKSMIDCLRILGVNIIENNCDLIVKGGNWIKPNKPLDCGNSATTMRLLMGALAAQNFSAELTGTPSLQHRPMKRIAEPLRQMGATISQNKAPLVITGGKLRGIVHHSEVASAQVKASLLLAAMQAKGTTTICQPGPSRDHSERMLSEIGINLQYDDKKVTLVPNENQINPTNITIPGDISSASFLLAAAITIPNSHITLRKIGINTTRTGILDAMKKMGADIDVFNHAKSGGEPIADISARYSTLKGIMLEGNIVTRMIDEFPIFTILSTQAKNTTIVRDAAELRLKESDRISSLIEELNKMGTKFEEYHDGYKLTGPQKLKGAKLSSHGDHRIAMSLAIAGMLAKGNTVISESDIADESYPNFQKTFNVLGAQIV